MKHFQSVIAKFDKFDLLQDTMNLDAGRYEFGLFHADMAIVFKVNENDKFIISKEEDISELEWARKCGYIKIVDCAVEEDEFGYECKEHGWTEVQKCHKCIEV